MAGNAAAGAQLPLALVHEDEAVTVVKVRGNDEMCRHLENLGFVEGAQVKVVSQGSASGTICQVKGSQLGIDRNTAMHITTN